MPSQRAASRRSQRVKDYLGPMRRPYERGQLAEDDLAPTWLEQLRAWLEDAAAAGLPEPNAMVLATAGTGWPPGRAHRAAEGVGRARIDLLHEPALAQGARAGRQPRAALVFPWSPIERQVVVDGRVEALGARESDEYFASRPRGARLGALASPQSEPIARHELERRFAELAERYGEDLPRPEWWGGLRVVPDQVEFWQGRPDRLHDRLRFRETGDGWILERLAP